MSGKIKVVCVALLFCVTTAVAFYIGKYSGSPSKTASPVAPVDQQSESPNAEGGVGSTTYWTPTDNKNSELSQGNDVVESATARLHKNIIRDEKVGAKTLEEKEFYENAQKAADTRLSKSFTSHLEFKAAFANDEYDPNWAPATESEIDKILEQNSELVFSNASLADRECRGNFCQITFTHSTSDLQEIKKIQGTIAYTLGKHSDINKHRQFINFLDEEEMLSYIYLERCRSCK